MLLCETTKGLTPELCPYMSAGSVVPQKSKWAGESAFILNSAALNAQLSYYNTKPHTEARGFVQTWFGSALRRKHSHGAILANGHTLVNPVRSLLCA